MAPTANVATLATSDRGLAQEREELHRTATAGVSQSPERDVPHAIEGSVDLLAPQQHFYLPSYQSPSNETTQTSPMLVAQRDEWEKLRVSRLALSIIIAATAVAGYVVHGFLTGDDEKSHSVATSEGGTTTTGSSNSVPSRTTDPSIDVAGNTTSADARNGGGAPATRAPTGAITISESAHEDTRTSTPNTTPTESPAPGEVASSVEAPIAAADSDAKQVTVGDTKSRGHTAATGARRPTGSRARTGTPSALPRADAPGIRTPIRSADRDLADRPQQHLCTETVAALALCDKPPQPKER